MWTSHFTSFLRRVIREGNFLVSVGDGPEMNFGNGCEPRVVVHIKDHATLRRLLLDPELALGEAYMEGALSIERDDVQGLMEIIVRNTADPMQLSLPAKGMAVVRHLRRKWDQSNPESRSRCNVAHHYDLTPAMYDLFLDSDLQYSCAYFQNARTPLDVAQADKKAHIARKLLITPGMHVLDIGCGWGGLALTLARDHGARVTGITLSREQLLIARKRASSEGLTDLVSFKLADYRTVRGQFDRIVSVGMFEHVGAPNFGTFFDVVRDRLAENGVALIHTIGRTARPSATNPWIAKYIFPGGYVPSLSEVVQAVQDSGLRIGDIECLRLHYAMTIRC
ncbi:MAG TPA: cyclopropane-fatty-acyl-phospholipid synthase family protein, partial [Paracoccaceae bacterium]|nr:cyclopropane-fatty-acyl-phospholipid synthase family protein [Paracoccaceae bacterium]